MAAQREIPSLLLFFLLSLPLALLLCVSSPPFHRQLRQLENFNPSQRLESRLWRVRDNCFTQPGGRCCQIRSHKYIRSRNGGSPALQILPVNRNWPEIRKSFLFLSNPSPPLLLRTKTTPKVYSALRDLPCDIFHGFFQRQGLPPRRRRGQAWTVRALPPFQSDVERNADDKNNASLSRSRRQVSSHEARQRSVGGVYKGLMTVPAHYQQSRSRNVSFSLLRLLEIHCQGLLPNLSARPGDPFKRFHVLEIASDQGEMTALADPLRKFLRRQDANVELVWQPSERNKLRIEKFFTSTRAKGLDIRRRGMRRSAGGSLPSPCVVQRPIEVDTSKTKGRWMQRALTCINPPRCREGLYSLILTSNLIHQAPWRTFEGLLDGAQGLLATGGLLVIHGSFSVDGVTKRWSTSEYKQWLYSKDPWWGVHDLRDVLSAAEDYGFRHLETLIIPTPGCFMASVIDTSFDGSDLFTSFPSDDFIMILENDHGRRPHVNLPKRGKPRARSSLAQAIVDGTAAATHDGKISLLRSNNDDGDDDGDADAAAW